MKCVIKISAYLTWVRVNIIYKRSFRHCSVPMASLNFFGVKSLQIRLEKLYKGRMFISKIGFRFTFFSLNEWSQIHQPIHRRPQLRTDQPTSLTQVFWSPGVWYSQWKRGS